MIWIMYVTISSWNPASLGPKRLSEYFIEIILFKTALLEDLLYRLLNYWANESLEVMLKAIKRSKVFLGRKKSKRLLLKYSFFSWYVFTTNFHSFLIFPKGARANCISSYLFKVSRVWFGKIQYVFNIFPREYRCMFGTVPWFGGKYDKSRDIFVFSYFSFTSLQWPFYREIPYKKKLLLLYQLLALKL